MPDTFLRDAETTRVTGIPRSTRYEMIAKGLFPKPIPLGPRSVAWSAAEIAEWQRQRIAERDGELESFKIRKRRLIPRISSDEYVARKLREANDGE